MTVGAICENYMSHYLYLSLEKYEELYGIPAEYNTIIYSVKDGKDDQIEKIGTKLLSMDGVLNEVIPAVLKEGLMTCCEA